MYSGAMVFTTSFFLSSLPPFCDSGSVDTPKGQASLSRAIITGTGSYGAAGQKGGDYGAYGNEDTYGNTKNYGSLIGKRLLLSCRVQVMTNF